MAVEKVGNESLKNNFASPAMSEVMPVETFLQLLRRISRGTVSADDSSSEGNCCGLMRTKV